MSSPPRQKSLKTQGTSRSIFIQFIKGFVQLLTGGTTRRFSSIGTAPVPVMAVVKELFMDAMGSSREKNSNGWTIYVQVCIFVWKNGRYVCVNIYHISFNHRWVDVWLILKVNEKVKTQFVTIHGVHFSSLIVQVPCCSCILKKTV